jgi:asparagine synthase (glutamine-hydrolysing)
MCGLVGICNLRYPEPIATETIKNMMRLIRHRGPDESGIYQDDWIGLGHVRLSIIDLAGGCQPIPNEDKSLWIVFNGEIFNYPDLRRELIEGGHRFSTASDTEVILHLYEDLGPACLEKLNGQFALAIWNARVKELFLARDRLGILPLYYTFHKERLLFASEIKALLNYPYLERSLNPEALAQVFTFWTTLPGETIFKNIQEIPAGHYLLKSDKKVRIQRYWDWPFPKENGVVNEKEVLARTRFLIEDAVRIRLRADVPVGCYISGGVDSSIITALVKRKFNHHLHTFSLCFEEEVYDEGIHQEYLVNYLETCHKAVQVKNSWIQAFFQEVVWHCEKPLLRTAPVPMFFLAEKVRQSGYKVVLTGEGADEIFGGYNIFKEAKIRGFWAKDPGSHLRPMLLGRLYPYIFSGERQSPASIMQSFFAGDLVFTEDPFFSHQIRWRNTGRLKTFFSPELRDFIKGYDCVEELRRWLPETFTLWDRLSKAQYLETILFMSNYLLSSQGDRVAMAHGIEIRPPFLDHRLLEFMAHVSSTLKMPGVREKNILKKAFQDLIPSRILDRPKHPYRAPIGRSFFGPYQSVPEVLSESSLKDTGLFDPSKIKILLRKATSDRPLSETEDMALAGIVSTQILHREFVKNFPSCLAFTMEPNRLIDRRTVA